MLALTNTNSNLAKLSINSHSHKIQTITYKNKTYYKFEDIKKFTQYRHKFPSILKKNLYSIQIKQEYYLTKVGVYKFLHLYTDSTNIDKWVYNVVLDEYNHLLSSNNLLTWSDFCKLYYDEFKIGRNKLLEMLRDNGVLMLYGREKNVPKMKFIKKGYFKIKTDKTGSVDGINMYETTTYITTRGIEFLRKFLTKY